MLTQVEKRHILLLANQLYRLKRGSGPDVPRSMLRHLDRLYEIVDEMGIIIRDPTGERYDETRIDCDATLSGAHDAALWIQDVIKPAVFLRQNDALLCIQRAIVVAGPKQENTIGND